jgi:hypothetical protein
MPVWKCHKETAVLCNYYKIIIKKQRVKKSHPSGGIIRFVENKAEGPFWRCFESIKFIATELGNFFMIFVLHKINECAL